LEETFFERNHFPLSDTMTMSSIVNIGQINIEELIRDVGKKEATRLLKQTIKNNVMLLNLQRQILEL